MSNRPAAGQVPPARSTHTAHRADYVLERGVWRATCRACGHQVTDAVRRQAAAHFRLHIHDARAAGA